MRDVKILILGTGLAGMSVALKLAERGFPVSLVSKTRLEEGATRYAQGGIASVWSDQDSFEEHARDTMDSGAGLCRREAVEACVREGPEQVRELIRWGVAFSRQSDQLDYDLHREGGHGKRRILHSQDRTGMAITEALAKQVRSHSKIEILENHIAIDLITDESLGRSPRGHSRCLGAYVLDEATGEVLTLRSDVTVLATGGAGKVYLYTSNPDVSTGDGIAMAYRAGARVANLEFMQFHPTCLYNPALDAIGKTFLITEALRGEGAILRNRLGEDFTVQTDPRGSLAPRDLVARAIDYELKKSGETHVFLDATSLSDEKFREQFPMILAVCKKMGIDPRVDWIPVVPAAHYSCGGVWTDLFARTSVSHLFAVGEVACTGLHGANRLASNSLLEAVVFSERCVRAALELLGAPTEACEDLPELPRWETGLAVPAEDKIDVAALWREIRTLMQTYVGIVRSDRRLKKAERRLEILRREVEDDYWKHLPTRDLIELRNLSTVAELIVQSGLLRKESRGLHYTVDYPIKNDEFFLRDTLL